MPTQPNSTTSENNETTPQGLEPTIPAERLVTESFEKTPQGLEPTIPAERLGTDSFSKPRDSAQARH
eukprot:3873839-Amphidinium_carterae.1